MTLLQTIIISIVEGLTEFLPVSSTGHMLIAENLLGVENSDFVRAFTIIIQFGAIHSHNHFLPSNHIRRTTNNLQRRFATHVDSCDM